MRYRHPSICAVICLSSLIVLQTCLQGCECSESLKYQYDRFNIQLLNASSRCFSHKSCSDGTFCSPVGFLDEYYGDWLPFGTCRPCSFCLCDSDAIDRTCPTHLCPRGEVSSILSLQGSFFSSQAIPDGRVCLSTWIFEGLTFRQISFYVDSDLYSSVAADHPDIVQKVTETLCAELHSGSKAGVFEVSAQNEITFTYTQGYDFHQNNSFVMRGIIRNDCPNVILTLDRSSIPIHVEQAANWAAPEGALQAFDFVSSTLVTCASGGDKSGFCIKRSSLDSRSPVALRLRRLDGILDSGSQNNVLQGTIVKDGWRKDVSSRKHYFPNGTLCSFIMEQSALAVGLVYFRTQLYGCIQDVQPQTTEQTLNTTPVLSTTLRLGTTSPMRPKSVTATRLTSSISPYPAQNTTTPAPPPTSTPPICSGLGNLYQFSGMSIDTPYVLNCPTGSINVLDYRQTLEVHWSIDLDATIAVWMSLLSGFRVNQDYITITSKNLPRMFITGADSDPTSYVKIRVCLYVYNCVEGPRFYNVREFNQTLDGPLQISFVSNANLGSGGAVLQYAAIPNRPQSRSYSVLSLKRSLRLVRSATNIPRGGAVCECGGISTDTCQSPFFQDAICNYAVLTWPWLGFHSHTFINASNFSGYVDAVVYFERFQNFQASKSLYVTASFKIYTPNLAHHLDAIALFKGEDDDEGSCDEIRSLNSCTRRSPFGNPPSLLKQLCWAYTSALSNPWSDVHVPNQNIRQFSGSVNFCSDVTESAGPGVYYVLLYSFVLKRVIAQVDYLQPRDCHGVSFPCSPVLIPNPNRQFDLTGALAVCPIMWYRNENFLCVPCTLGTFSGLLNSPSCFSCPVGKFSVYPYTGTESCIACPDGSSNTSVTDDAIALLCKSNVTYGQITQSTTVFRATTIVALTTSTRRYCGDGLLVYEGGQTAVGKECDAGSLQLLSSASISIYDVLGSPVEVRKYLQQDYRMCSRTTCKLGTYFCGDGIITGSSPVYSLADCTLGRDSVLCGKASELRFQNITVIYHEECDDGNFRNGDGCSSQCRLEPLFRCRISIGQSFCERTCNNGIVDVDTGEQCDDGNTVNGDGCSRDCQIECGFSCVVPETQGAASKCDTFCGDGVIAGSEECDTELVAPSVNNPNRQGCSSYCRRDNGWACSMPLSICVSNISVPQFCSPICGDGLIYFPEECDDVEWNLDDKSCSSACRINREFVCYGFPCMAPSPSQSTSTSDLMMSLQKYDQGMAEGVIVLRDIFFTDNSMLSRSLAMFASKYSFLPTSFPSIMSTFVNMSMASEYTSIVTPPFCTKPPDSTLRALNGRFVEDLRFLANNVSCKYRILPRPLVNSDRFIVIRMKFTALELDGESYLALSSQTSSSQVRELSCKFVAPFKTSDLIGPFYLLAPVTMFIFGSAQSSTENNVSTTRLRIDVQYETLNESDTTVEKIICLSRCQCNVSCGQKCFRFHQSVSVESAPDVANGKQEQGRFFETYLSSLQYHQAIKLFQKQVVAFDFKSFESLGSEEINMRNKYIFPSEFSQYPETSLLVAMEEDSASDLGSLERSWKGFCFQTYSESPILCDVVLHITKNTILKHIWNCPLRGSAVGRILQLDTNSSTGIDSLFVLTYFRNGKIVWTSPGLGETSDTVTRFMIGLQHVPNLSPGQGIQIILEGATRTLMGNPKFSDGGLFEQESNCRVLNLEPYNGVSSLTPLNSLPPQTEADSYLVCNQSIATAIMKLQESDECLTLVRALLMRDFWAPLSLDVRVFNSDFESESILGYSCRSPCKQQFVNEIQKSVDICEAAWKGQWSNWNTASRTFKLLISSVSALYWYSVMCSSNHEGRSCADFTIPALKLFSANTCPTLLNQSLFSPQFFLQGYSCSENCSVVLKEYSNMLGCCAPTIETAGKIWLDRLTSDSLSSISFDFGDRSNPFNSTFPKNENNLVDIYFNTQGALKVVPTGLIGNVDRQPKTIGSAFQLADEICMDCAWPYQNQQCCNSFKCINGNKSFAGSCSCSCPEGQQGAQCDFAGYFAEAILNFDISATVFPGKNFSYCQVKAFYSSAAKIFSVEVEDLNFEPYISERRRSINSGMSALLRIRLPSCTEAQRMTQKVSSLSDTSVLSLFVANGVPPAKIFSIWTFCDGKKTVCGASSDKVTAVTQQIVFAACTAGILQNSSLNGVDVSGSTSGLSTVWIIPVLAFGSIFLLCMLGGLIFFFRTKIARKLIRTYKTAKKKGAEGLAKLSEQHKKEAVVSDADIVFSKSSNSCQPSECYIMHQFEPMEIEIKFMHSYDANMSTECNKTEAKHFSEELTVCDNQIDKLSSHSHSDLETSDFLGSSQISAKTAIDISKLHGIPVQKIDFYSMSMKGKDSSESSRIESVRRWEAFD